MNPTARHSWLEIKHFLPIALAVFLFAQSGFSSTIAGFVYAKGSRVALPDIDVELLNENYQLRGRMKTDGAGRYTFANLADGNYMIRVLPFRHDLEDQEIMVEITTLKTTGSGLGNTYVTQDFYLSPKRGGLAATEIGVVFAQEVPKEARKLYEAAIADLTKNRRPEGIRGLRDSIALFPNYYDANFRLGNELVGTKDYGEAAQLFMKAAEVNQKSATSLYLLGSCLHQIDRSYNKGALIALKAALELAPSSVQVLYLIGKIERLEGNYQNAEKHLVQAKKLSKQGIPEIHSELAQLYGNNMGKYANAADELEMYLKVSKLSKEDETKTKKIITDLREKSKKSR
ncbi:MAG: hypothetical protein ACT4O9_02610 [Blastocatellia bacterium]